MPVLLSMFLVKVYFSLSIVHSCLRRCLLFFYYLLLCLPLFSEKIVIFIMKNEYICFLS